VVLFNACIGLAISAVYKYADAVVKTFATATVTVNLVVFSALYGLQQPSLVAWMGVLVVITATAIYARVAVFAAAPAPTTPTSSSSTTTNSTTSSCAAKVPNFGSAGSGGREDSGHKSHEHEQLLVSAEEAAEAAEEGAAGVGTMLNPGKGGSVTKAFM
jgi:hypothetical protein